MQSRQETCGQAVAFGPEIERHPSVAVGHADIGLAARRQRQLAEAVRDEIVRQTRTLSRREIVERSLADFGALIVVESLAAACALANRIAPEHVEVITEDDEATAAQINHAGAIFIGAYSPEPVGDYFAGTNHVLPTGGAARFSSALGVYDFLKRTSVIRYTREELTRTASAIERLALAEGFEAHARSATIRYE